MTNLHAVVVRGICMLAIWCMPALAYGQYQSVGYGGTLIVGPGSGGVNSLLLKLANGTEEDISNITIYLPGDVKIVSADLSEGPGNTEDQDAVDDNRNGQLDPGETDDIASPAGQTVTIILKDGKIPKDSTLEIALRFDKDLPPDAVFVLYFSKEIKGQHYELALYSTPDVPLEVDRSGEVHLGPQLGGVNSTTAYLKNETDEEVSNVTIFLPGDVKIISADITEAPGDLEDQDAVDDNRDGKLDAGETDGIASPGGQTVTIILKNGKIPKGGIIEIALRFDKDLPANTVFAFYFSKEIKGQHYELATETAADYPYPVEREGSGVVGPTLGGINSTTMSLRNDTGEPVSNVTVHIPESMDVRITDLDISEAPGELEDQDAVDDNRNGKLDAGETDNKPATPGKTVTVILKNGKIPKGGVVEIAIRFDKDLPVESGFWVYFSKEIDGVHYELAADTTGMGAPGTTSWQPVGPGVIRTALMPINSTDTYITDLQVNSPIAAPQLVVGPPFDSSLVTPTGPGTFALHLIPALAPRDFIDLGIEFSADTDSNTAPLSIQTIQTAPFDCQLSVSGFTTQSCDPFGNYSLTIDSLAYNTSSRTWQEYEFVNTTDKNISDLQVLLAGTGGSLTTTILTNPEGCPSPQIPSNGKVTNTLELIWPSACVEPGQGVKVKVGSLNGPLKVASGVWTIGGQKEADLNLETGVLEGRESGIPDQSMKFYLDGVFAGDFRPNGSGLDTVVLTALPANGAAGLDISVVWEGRSGCTDTVPDAYDAPDCLNTGFFAIEEVEQLSYQDPVLLPLSDDGELVFRYFNPPAAAPRYLNVLYLPPLATTPVWLADNILLEPFPDTVQLITRVDFDPENVLSPAVFDWVKLSVLITDTIFTAIPAPGNYVIYPVQFSEYSIGDFIEDSTLLEPIFPLLISAPIVEEAILWVPETPVYSDLRTDMPNIDLDNSKYKAGSKQVPAGYAGDRKACAPAGTTNSFAWLRKHHPAIDDSLKKAFGTGDEAAILRKMLYEFSQLMKRKPNEGARPDNIVKAKLEFVDKYKLPIRVKYQSTTIDTSIKSPDKRYGHAATNENQPTTPQTPKAKISLDWIKSEFDKGEDVELGIYWVKYDASNKRYVLKGHLVTLSDIDKANKNWKIKFRDDRNQRNKGGLRKDRSTKAKEFKGSPADFRGMIRLPDLDNSNGKAFLGSAFSESFDSTVTFIALNIKTVDITPASCVHSPNGGISLLLDGGVPPYTVSWSNGAEGPVVTDLVTGSYTCTITDAAGNTLIETIFVPAPPAMVIEPISIISPFCPLEPTGGIEVAVQGGTPPYLVSWENGTVGPVLTGVPAGDYIVVVMDASGCAEVLTITLPAADDIAPIISATDANVVLDAGAVITLTADMFQTQAVDNCGMATIVLEPAFLDCGSLGTTPVTITALDASGNSSSVLVSATLADVLAPVVVTVPNITVALDPAGQAVIQVSDVLVSATDNCGIDTIILSRDMFSCDDFLAGAIPLEIDVIVIDIQGNATVQTVLVNLEDPFFPVISCPANIQQQYCGPVIYDLPTATDNCDLFLIDLQSGLGSGSVFPIGTHTEVYQVMDAAGNLATCSFTVTVTDEWPVQADIQAVACYGESNGAVTLSVTGGQEPYTYIWSDGQTGQTATQLPAGMIGLTLTDANGCTQVALFDIPEPLELVVTDTMIQDETNSQSNGSVIIVLAGGTPPYSYNSQVFADTLFLSGLAAGSYTLQIADANSCTVEFIIQIKNLVGTAMLPDITVFRVYPVPARQALTIEVALTRPLDQMIRMTDVTGRLIQEWPKTTQSEQRLEVNITDFRPGLYLIELHLEVGTVLRKAIVLE